MSMTSLNPPWTNWAGNETCHPQEIAYPRTEEEVSEIIASATRRGLPIGVVGAGHSFSTICLTDGVLISLDRMRGIVHADPGTRLVRARAGTRIRDFGDALWDAGLCLKNQGDIDSQHIVGAMSTATHGSGIRQQCFSATARRFRVVLPSGEAADVTADDPELLAAMQVSLGLLGVITEVEFEAREAFAIAERLDPFDPRPHWGKIHYMDRQLLQAAFPEYERFLRIRKSLDPSDAFLGPHMSPVFG